MEHKLDQSFFTDIVSNHSDNYMAFIDEIREFINENFEQWQLEQPDWWTNDFMMSLPESVLSEAQKEEIRFQVDNPNAKILHTLDEANGEEKAEEEKKEEREIRARAKKESQVVPQED